MKTYNGITCYEVQCGPIRDSEGNLTGYFTQKNNEQKTVQGTYLDEIKDQIVEENNKNILEDAVDNIIGLGSHAILTDNESKYYLFTSSYVSSYQKKVKTFYDALLIVLYDLGYVNDEYQIIGEGASQQIEFTITPRGDHPPYKMYFRLADSIYYFITPEGESFYE